MATAVVSNLALTLRSILSNTVGLANAQASVETGTTRAIASGTGADQANRIYTESAKSIAAAYDVDLSGSLVDALGAAFILARLKLILVIAAVANTGNVIIGNDAASPILGFGAITHTWAVPPGGVFLAYAPDATGWPITAVTGDILQFTPSAGTQVFDFALLGSSV